LLVFVVGQHMLDEANLRLKADTGNDSIMIATNIEDVLVLVDIYRVEGVSEVLEMSKLAQLDQLAPYLKRLGRVGMEHSKLDQPFV